MLKEIADLKKSPWYNDDYGFGTKQARQEGVSIVEDLCIKQALTVDVTEVIRCKDCQHSKFIKTYSKYMCDKHNEGRGELKYSNDFCSDGKKKTD